MLLFSRTTKYIINIDIISSNILYKSIIKSKDGILNVSTILNSYNRLPLKSKNCYLKCFNRTIS